MAGGSEGGPVPGAARLGWVSGPPGPVRCCAWANLPVCWLCRSEDNLARSSIFHLALAVCTPYLPGEGAARGAAPVSAPAAAESG